MSVLLLAVSLWRIIATLATAPLWVPVRVALARADARSGDHRTGGGS